MDLMAVYGYAVSISIHSDRPGFKGLDRGWALLSVSAKNCTDSCHKLSVKEWFRHVVIGTHLQAEHLVSLAVLTADHDDRYVRFSAQLAERIDTIGAGQGPVQENQISTITVEVMQSVATIRGRGNFVTLVSHQLGQGPAVPCIVIDYQYTCHVTTGCLPVYGR